MGQPNIVERIQHGYDRAGNRVWRAELVDLSRLHDEFYRYDGMHRLVSFERGTLNSTNTGIVNQQFAQCWTLDATGNWKQFKQDNDGNGNWDVVQQRTSNQANEITSLQQPASPSGALPLALPAPLGTVNNNRSSWTVPQYDAAGNMTTMPQAANPTQGFTTVYDAWNRPVAVKANGETVAQYQYDGLGRRTIKETYSGGELQETRNCFYTSDLRNVEERTNGSPGAERQFVWGQRYIDDLVLRDRDATASGVLTERLFGMQDPNWNMIAVCNPNGNVQERYGYDAYGVGVVLSGGFAVLVISNVDWETRFGGGRWDCESGNNYFRRRYELAVLGCWSTRDPKAYAAGDVNLLRYVGNKSLNFTDPTGLSACDEFIEELLKYATEEKDFNPWYWTYWDHRSRLSRRIACRWVPTPHRYIFGTCSSDWPRFIEPGNTNPPDPTRWSGFCKGLLQPQTEWQLYRHLGFNIASDLAVVTDFTNVARNKDCEETRQSCGCCGNKVNQVNPSVRCLQNQAEVVGDKLRQLAGKILRDYLWGTVGKATASERLTKLLCGDACSVDADICCPAPSTELGAPEYRGYYK